MLGWLLYFPVPAGEMRNDLYVILEKGEFEKGGKSVARNVEITVYVLAIDGQILKVIFTFCFICYVMKPLHFEGFVSFMREQ